MAWRPIGSVDFGSGRIDMQGTQSGLTSGALATVAEAVRAFVIVSNKHVGGGTSAADLLTCLYFSGLANLSLADRRAGRQDNLVYSKGHAPAPLYACLWLHGHWPELSLDDLLRFGDLDHPIPRMPRRDVARGLDMGNGSLGQGLSFGVGLAVADRKLGRERHTYVVLGDAECAEGLVWEGAADASRLQLANLTVVLDANGFGSGVSVPGERWLQRWESFGWRALEVDGHEHAAICRALAETRGAGPVAIVARTIKGFGLSAGVAGTNRVHNEAPAEARPALNLPALVAEAQALVRGTWEPAAGAPPPASPALPWLEVSDLFEPTPTGATFQTKKVGGELLEGFGSRHGLFLLSPDAITNSGLEKILRGMGSWSWEKPESWIMECPIAEAGAVSLAGGLAAGGARPVVFVMEGFVWRALDAIRESVCFADLPVVVIGTSGGLGDSLGPMVQSDSCFAALSDMVGLECFEAQDVNEAKVLLVEALNTHGPAYLRLPHESFETRTGFEAPSRAELEVGCRVLRDSEWPQVSLVSAGSVLSHACAAAEALEAEHGLRCRLLEVFSVSRLARAPRTLRRELLPPDLPAVSVHNAPPIVLGRFLGPRSAALGLRDFGGFGKPLSALYERAGLGVRSIVDHAIAVCQAGSDHGAADLRP
jgi:transketolase